MVDVYKERFPDADLEVAFFHGGVPTQALLEATKGLPIRLSCNPADLDRESAATLKAAGCLTIELEAMTLDPHVLRTCNRDYTTTRVRNMARTLRAEGFSIGLHLVPGLPGSDVEGALNDARSLIDTEGAWVDFVRIWPALAFEGSTLDKWAKNGRWQPHDTSAMVDILTAIVDICAAGQIDIARVGIQPGQDIPVRATAGPVHPNIRGEVESRRFGARLFRQLHGTAEGADIVVQVHPKDLSWAKGTSNVNARSARTRYKLGSLQFATDESVSRGELRIAATKG
jgi:histone acetyltransferase (RNA polymerase elongator complex component)